MANVRFINPPKPPLSIRVLAVSIFLGLTHGQPNSSSTEKPVLSKTTPTLSPTTVSSGQLAKNHTTQSTPGKLSTTSTSGTPLGNPAPAATPPSVTDVVSLTFLTVFILGFVGVVIFYVWKRTTDSRWRVPLSYQYSVLNQFEGDPDDDLEGLGDLGDTADDVGLVISQDSSDADDDLTHFQSGGVRPNSLVFPSMMGPMPTAVPIGVPGSVAMAAQTGNGIVTNGRISSAILDDSDEELLH